MADFLSVYITAASSGEAEAIALALVEERLAACVNIFPHVQSVYRWQDRVELTSEIVLIAKTSADTFSRLEQKVKSLSSYECPCIVAMPITMGSKDYLAWIGQGTAVPNDGHLR